MIYTPEKEKKEQWRKVRLGDVAEITIGQSPESKYYNANGDGLPFLQGNRTFGVKYPTFDTYTSLSKKLAEAGDVIMSIRAPVGDVNITPIKMCIGRGLCSLRHREGEQDYLYYLMRNSARSLTRHESGTIFGSVNYSDISNLEIIIPPLPTQRAIAATLACLDDKIEVNNRINANLEAQAQVLFKSWFVDFEPFKDGEFVDSELGSIPKGWKVGRLTDIADYINGLAMQKHRRLSKAENAIPVLKIKELRQGSCDINSDLCSEDVDDLYIVNDGDVIFSWSGSLLVDIWCGGKCRLNQHLFKVISKEYDKWYYLLWTKYHLNNFKSIAADKATTMGHIKREHLDGALVLIPDDISYGQISSIMQPIMSAIIVNKVQSRTLAAIRDTLLPKLMSGEIEVEEE